jgi:hypothetical protein
MDAAQIESFLDQIRLRAWDDAYIDAAEEKESLMEAMKLGFNIDEAHSLLKQACSRFGFGVESDLAEVLEVCLQQFCQNDGKIDIEEFEDAVGIGVGLLKRNAPRAKVNHVEVENIAYKIIQKNRYAIQGKLKKHLKKTLGFDV